MLKNVLGGAAVALTLGGAMIATATPAAAQWRGQGGYGQNQFRSGYN